MGIGLIQQLLHIVPCFPCWCVQSSGGLASAGQYNDVATVFMSVPAETIKRMFSLSVSVDEGSEGPEDFWACSDVNACRFTPRSLSTIAFSTPVLMALASGLSIPGGLFMPSIMVRLGHLSC